MPVFLRYIPTACNGRERRGKRQNCEVVHVTQKNMMNNKSQKNTQNKISEGH